MTHLHKRAVSETLHPWGKDVLAEMDRQGRSIEWLIYKLKVNRSTFYRWTRSGPSSPWISKNIEQILENQGFLRKWWRNEI